MTTNNVVFLAIAAGLIPFAAFFAATDAALGRISRARVAEMRQQGIRGATRLSMVIRDAPRYTNLLLLLRMAAELFATVLVTVVLIDLFEVDWQAIVLAGLIMTVVSYVLIGVGPRTLGRQHPYAIALRTAGMTWMLGRLFGPLASLLILLGNAITPGQGFREGPFATEAELRELVDMAEAGGAVEHGEREMIHSVFELGDTLVREVMVPRPDVVWIEQTKTVRQALALALRSGFSRIPVIGENVDDVVGVVYLKDLAGRAQDPNDQNGRSTKVEEVMRPATFVPESKPVDELLREMQARRIHVAVVIDEYGGAAGLVTIEDILEEIVGEIADEYDVERPPVQWIDPNTARVTARLSVQDLANEFSVPIPNGDVDTVSGLMAQSLGRVPIPGAQAVVAGLALTAESAGGRRNRIDTILVHRMSSQ